MLILDVFKDHKTAKILNKLALLNIAIVLVPAHMTYFFQPLDFTVNGEAKRFVKDKFTTWYLEEVKQQIESRGDSTGINENPWRKVLKPLHAIWLVDLYNL